MSNTTASPQQTPVIKMAEGILLASFVVMGVLCVWNFFNEEVVPYSIGMLVFTFTVATAVSWMKRTYIVAASYVLVCIIIVTRWF